MVLCLLSVSCGKKRKCGLNGLNTRKLCHTNKKSRDLRFHFFEVRSNAKLHLSFSRSQSSQNVESNAAPRVQASSREGKEGRVRNVAFATPLQR